MIGQPAKLINLRPFLKRLAHYAARHPEFCQYCPKIQDCWNHYDQNEDHFSKGKCQATIRRHLLHSVRTGKRP